MGITEELFDNIGFTRHCKMWSLSLCWMQCQYWRHQEMGRKAYVMLKTVTHYHSKCQDLEVGTCSIIFVTSRYTCLDWSSHCRLLSLDLHCKRCLQSGNQRNSRCAYSQTPRMASFQGLGDLGENSRILSTNLRRRLGYEANWIILNLSFETQMNTQTDAQCQERLALGRWRPSPGFRGRIHNVLDSSPCSSCGARPYAVPAPPCYPKLAEPCL